MCRVAVAYMMSQYKLCCGPSALLLPSVCVVQHALEVERLLDTKSYLCAQKPMVDAYSVSVLDC